MTDFEDAHSPAWLPTLDGQLNVRDAYRRTISDENADGRQYLLNEETATLCVRPRGLHLMERHVLVDGEPVAGSFFDFGLTIYHNRVAQQSHGNRRLLLPAQAPVSPGSASLERRFQLCRRTP